MFPSYAGAGCRTRRRQRKVVLERLRNWFPFSNSSPVEGIVEAIRTYYAFRAAHQPVRARRRVHRRVRRLGGARGGRHQPRGQSGRRRVRIHSIGFPVRPDAPQYTSVRFATLMRILCDRNGGTFRGDSTEPGSYRR